MQLRDPKSNVGLALAPVEWPLAYLKGRRGFEKRYSALMPTHVIAFRCAVRFALGVIGNGDSPAALVGRKVRVRISRLRRGTGRANLQTLRPRH
jgi:hypothetical protein